MLADPDCVGNLPGDDAARLFDPEYWGKRREVTGGRGAAWFIEAGDRQWVLRHYRRGGFVARFCTDAYVWLGEERVRAFVEWRLLSLLAQRGLPVPRPVAARYSRAGVLYRCDLITERIMDAEPLSGALGRGVLAESVWRGVGGVIARMHGEGVDHADLNAHNLLLDPRGAVSVIDFDRGRVRAPGVWRAGNLQRLQRSLEKISRGLPPDRYSPQAWDWLMAGYGA